MCANGSATTATASTSSARRSAAGGQTLARFEARAVRRWAACAVSSRTARRARQIISAAARTEQPFLNGLRMSDGRKYNVRTPARRARHWSIAADIVHARSCLFPSWTPRTPGHSSRRLQCMPRQTSPSVRAAADASRRGGSILTRAAGGRRGLHRDGGEADQQHHRVRQPGHAQPQRHDPQRVCAAGRRRGGAAG